MLKVFGLEFGDGILHPQQNIAFIEGVWGMSGV